jgi:hypothetical protein
MPGLALPLNRDFTFPSNFQCWCYHHYLLKVSIYASISGEQAGSIAQITRDGGKVVSFLSVGCAAS